MQRRLGPPHINNNNGSFLGQLFRPRRASRAELNPTGVEVYLLGQLLGPHRSSVGEVKSGGVKDHGVEYRGGKSVAQVRKTSWVT
ncbi:hypothetical protein Pmani_018456 [Petrolisthes manimaculis]|uniref:Uncharacterized protein n=1 Tax=Petrolisthes manimaculis TaxID=1843537 RepID=A0AAE1PK97_9EUCA|nr:hypothetical protein Pmani_018456 [Petrolisthes manimaculis]